MNTARSVDDDAADPEECPVCRQLRLDGPDPATFVVVPSDGGGWQAWAAALLRLFIRIGHGPTQAVIVTQDASTRRYVQALVGHGTAVVQASSNVYLDGSSVLTADQTELMATIGWRPPTPDCDNPDEMPANWSLPHIQGDWRCLVEMIVATAVGVFGFDERLPVEVRTFGCDSPCRGCSWTAAELEAASGGLS